MIDSMSPFAGVSMHYGKLRRTGAIFTPSYHQRIYLLYYSWDTERVRGAPLPWV